MFFNQQWQGWQRLLIENENGNVGIGATNPTEKLQIGGVPNFANAYNKIKIGGVINFEQILLGQYGNGAEGLEFINHGDATKAHGVRLFVYADEAMGLQFQTAPLSTTQQGLNYQTRMFISNGGNIGIGTTSPDYKLDVVGTIRAHEILVNTQKWADFVFKPEYELKTLSEVEAFIQENGHLPEIPNASEAEKAGVNVGEMQGKLLQKIEELTLYVIQQEKEMQEQKSLIKQLQEQIKLKN